MAQLNPHLKVDPRLTELAVRLTTIQHEAMALGLYATGHKLHDAVKVVGYEIEHVTKKEQAA